MYLLYVYYYFLCIIKCIQDEEQIFKVREPSGHHVKDGGINRVALLRTVRPMQWPPPHICPRL